MANRRPRFAFILLALMALPSYASANAGTPLMWATMLHLAIGNAFIGLFEGLLVGWLFKVPKGRAILLLIAANYFSAWIGGAFLGGAIAGAVPLDLNNAWKWFWVMCAVTYGITILFEWPFVFLLFRKADGAWRRSVKASLVVQTSSYLVLFGWYWMASGTSLYTRMQIVAPEALDLPANVSVYFISPKDGDVYRAQSFSKPPGKFRMLGSTNDNDRLLVRTNALHPDRWDLVARIDGGRSRDFSFIPIRTNFVAQVVPEENVEERIRNNWFHFGPAGMLGTAVTNDWEFRTGFWAVEGLHAMNHRSGERIHFSYETPFAQWIARGAIHLPTDKVLFQLGDDQICAFDPVTKRIALLWHGRGPTAIIE